MSSAKQQSEQHLIDAEGQQLLRSRLPRHWVLREYRPDYGLDFALEVFAAAKEGKYTKTYETLGEHIFIQLKSVKSCEVKPLKLYGRMNVEKGREVLNKEDLVGEMDTVRFQLDTPELVTVERMGVGVPVLLVVADISRKKCFFVCLNDYIDKILIPRHQDYRNKGTRTIHVPVLNEIGDKTLGLVALRWYAKRPKLFAAFQRFVFQHAELEYSLPSPKALVMARYFAERIASYDFWDDTEMWQMIPYYGAVIRRFLETSNPGLMKVDEDLINREVAKGNKDVAQKLIEQLRQNEVRELWRLLSVLPQNYEDVCREWFLPTGLGVAASYA